MTNDQDNQKKKLNNHKIPLTIVLEKLSETIVV